MLDTILRGRSDDVVLINGAILRDVARKISRDVARNIAPYARDDFCYAWRPIRTPRCTAMCVATGSISSPKSR